MEILIVLIIGAAVFFFWKMKRGNAMVADENTFSQEGVTVNFANGTITLGGKQFSVNQITGINVVKNNARGEKFVQTGTVNISIDDFTKPIHKVTFMGLGAFVNADEFMQRLSIALRKAGGPSFV